MVALTGCINVLGSRPIDFSVFHQEMSDRVSCNGGLQATLTLPDFNITVASPLVSIEEDLWDEEIGKYKPYTDVAAVIEAYCYREGQEPGYVRAKGILEVGGELVVPIYATSPHKVYEENSLADCSSATWLESVEPVPCIAFLEPRN